MNGKSLADTPGGMEDILTIDQLVEIGITKVISMFSLGNYFFPRTVKFNKSNRVFLHRNLREIFFFTILLFFQHLHQVAFAPTLEFRFFLIDTEEFRNIILVDDIVHHWNNWTDHCHQVQKNQQKG
ncbi:hypothetical protein [Flagellimonas sp.]|uniref:hypothetical protein n=1 Tax=Flagellimonas sp. TaxID=2058762 RepID=UPI003BAE1B39